MEEKSRKLLTEYLGLCWHEKGNKAWIDMFGGPLKEECKHCANKGIDNRTFTTPDDMMAVKDKLVEKGDVHRFLYFAKGEWEKTVKEMPFAFWLINPTRFCELVGEWLEVKDVRA